MGEDRAYVLHLLGKEETERKKGLQKGHLLAGGVTAAGSHGTDMDHITLSHLYPCELH